MIEHDQESSYPNMEYEEQESSQVHRPSENSVLNDEEEEWGHEDEQDPDLPGPSGLQHNRSKYKRNPVFSLKKPLIAGKEESVEQKFQKPDSFSEILDDELLKARMGLGTDAILKELLTNLETQRVNKEPTSGKQLKEDGFALKKFSQLAIYRIADLSDENFKILDPALMAQKLRDCCVEQEEPDCEKAPTFSLIGKNLGHLLRKAPDHAYLRPCLAFNQTQNVRVKKERIKKEKPATQTQVILGKSTKQIHDASKDESSITKELDNVRRHLKAVWKQSNTNQVSYYDFVLHPTNFGETVENMFYVSFLIKDGIVGLEVSSDTHMPTIVKLSSAHRAQRDNVDQSNWNTTQALSKITHAIWQILFQRRF